MEGIDVRQKLTERIEQVYDVMEMARRYAEHGGNDLIHTIEERLGVEQLLLPNEPFMKATMRHMEKGNLHAANTLMFMEITMRKR